LLGGSVQAIRDVCRSVWQMCVFRPDCIHVNTSASFSNAKDWLILRVAKALGIRRTLHYHVGFLPRLAELQNFQWRLVRANMRLASKVFVLGKVSEAAVRTHVPGVDVVALPNPVNELVAEAQAHKPAGSPTHFLFLGHVREGKGVFDLVRACAQMDAARFRLSIIGSVLDGDKDKLRALAGEGSERWLSMPGEISREQCLVELSHADALILPSTGLFEAFPYVVLEAMAAGRAVIATNRGAISEMLDIGGGKPCGLLVGAGKIAELRLAMERLMADPTLRRELGERGRLRARENYCAPKIVGSLLTAWFPAENGE
jgi:glycosyltransferase involved in cell wall biosynthesis